MIGVASDHAAFELKAAVVAALKAAGHELRDFGTHSPESCDYPDTVLPCAEALGRGELELAVVMCGSGLGASIAANKVRGVRAALCLEPEQAGLARRHNDANCLALSGRLRSIGQNLELLGCWLDAAFEGGRHQRRVDKIHRRTGC
jgi:ribose 5-phosphate isomerase B